MDKVTFIILSFEGPDRYSHAGGLGTRVAGLSDALARMGFETHLFFIGDPNLPGHEVSLDGKLNLHRWCQWISKHHPRGVYDGEEGKLPDWTGSIPWWLENEFLPQTIASGSKVVVIAEEWQTVGSILGLRNVIARHGWQRDVKLLWNANNTFGFDRIDWPALKLAAAITTVSKYMKHVLWRFGVDARVIPNGIAESWLKPLDRRACTQLARAVQGRLTLAKVARWDPDKRWDMAVDAVAYAKRLGGAPLFIARGGAEQHGREVVARAERRGLKLARVRWSGGGAEQMTEAIRSAVDCDMIVLDGYLTEEQRRVLFHVADAVLANSGVEPFGLVGLETMAVGGIALVGCTGEDYVTPGHDAISLQSDDPREIVHHIRYLNDSDEVVRKMRLAARQTASRYTWGAVIERVQMPYLNELGLLTGSNRVMLLAPAQPAETRHA
ncbi:MAG: glycosyltransferase family 4 protein, partial [Chloroflexi bacterium]|nr:glycosyltransferase family 4 protein [Chloroflexota bacterium]